MRKVLLIEDDLDLYQLLKYSLETAGLEFVGANAGIGAVELCQAQRPDLILLDIMLPDSSGLEICARIRNDAALSGTPIIFVTGRGSEEDRVLGLELGANDYIVKPFSVRELMVRVKVQLRPVAETAGTVLRSGSLELDRSRLQVSYNGHRISLTTTEFRILEFLMSRPGIVFSREQLLNAVWGGKASVMERCVDVYILRLRKKIETGKHKSQFINSVRGFGYSFDPGIVSGAFDAPAPHHD
jgi:two-component system phosphate regulon response regulator PhoB